MIDEEKQKMLNTPLADPNGLKPEDKQFLEIVLKMVENSEIDLMKPSSLVNQSVYKKMGHEGQGKVDLEAMNLCNSLREIKNLYNAGFTETHQMKNLVSLVRLEKERLESESGDIFVI